MLDKTLEEIEREAKREIMMKLDYIISIIYNFYPKHCEYGSKYYKKTKEYKKYLKHIKKIKYKNMEKTIDKVLKNYYLKTWPIKNEAGIHFSVLLHKGQDILDHDVMLLESLGGRRLDLEVYISKLTKMYYLYVMETIHMNDEWTFKVFDVDKFVDKEIISNLEILFTQQGFSRLTRDLINEIVPGIETELHYEGEVKVFHCLFSDLENML